MASETLYANFCNLRSQIVSKLTNWRQAVTNQELTAKALSFNLISLTDHMNKSFLKLEIIECPTISACYRYRVNRIINTVLTTVESLQDSEEIVYTETHVLSGILGMVIVQIGRLSICPLDSETVDRSAIEMDMMADAVEAQVGLGNFECVDESMIDEQCLLKEIWEWMHDVDPGCECSQCLTRNVGDLSTDTELRTLEGSSGEFEMTVTDMDIELWSPTLLEGSGEDLEMTDMNVESCIWSPNQVREGSSEDLGMTGLEIESWLLPLCNFDMEVDSWPPTLDNFKGDMMEV
ncbi:hypothetical protein N7478_001865 [Penicillium angulare]|uniref:uncharacterized protein n=1 Tax=Penicillium angulare TaxID=116970 RepID=UPI00253F7B6C|nr:uncharacterized protein N7478_001865 [Penicillium angulare]KAJ5288835.1 hypothetical protein N7478_001865 [Penicillium angulare]